VFLKFIIYPKKFSTNEILANKKGGLSRLLNLHIIKSS